MSDYIGYTPEDLRAMSRMEGEGGITSKDISIQMSDKEASPQTDLSEVLNNLLLVFPLEGVTASTIAEQIDKVIILSQLPPLHEQRRNTIVNLVKQYLEQRKSYEGAFAMIPIAYNENNSVYGYISFGKIDGKQQSVIIDIKKKDSLPVYIRVANTDFSEKKATLTEMKESNLEQVENDILQLLTSLIEQNSSSPDIYMEEKRLRELVATTSSFSNSELSSAVLEVLQRLRSQYPSLVFQSGELHPYDGGGMFLKIFSAQH